MVITHKDLELTDLAWGVEVFPGRFSNRCTRVKRRMKLLDETDRGFAQHSHIRLEPT